LFSDPDCSRGGSSLLVVTWAVLHEGEQPPPSVARFHGSIRAAAETAR